MLCVLSTCMYVCVFDSEPELGATGLCPDPAPVDLTIFVSLPLILLDILPYTIFHVFFFIDH